MNIAKNTIKIPIFLAGIIWIYGTGEVQQMFPQYIY